MKAMVSQPMNGLTEEQIFGTRNNAIKTLENLGYEVINNDQFTDNFYITESMKKRGIVQIPLYFLAKSLDNMSLCNAVYFCKGWEAYRGCKMEHDVAVAYGLHIIYEK